MMSVLLTLSAATWAEAPKKPLKVYILAGQSNMEGHAKIETFDYIGDDPNTAPMLKDMRGPDGKPRVCDHVWISYLTGSPDKGTLGEGFGKLTAGYGSRKDPKEDGGQVGPEFTFGIYASKAYDGPILIIKTAWGGKSLHTDFRSPSAGPYEFNAAQLEGYKKQGKEIEQVKADKVKATGRYYKLMIDHVKKVLADPKRIVPDYDPTAGYEIAGFVWFQGWNDMCDPGTYPDSNKPGGYAKYSEWMADFIRDVRKDLGAPKMLFVIGVIGVNGDKATGGLANLRPAMAAPAEMREFKGNVAAVQTAPYWDKPLAGIEEKLGKLGKVGYYLSKGGVPGHVVANGFPIAYSLRKEYWDTDPKDRKMTKEQQQEYLKEYRAKLITPDEDALWKRGASNAGYHYLGCGKTLALIGKAFAEAMVKMEKK
jgi:alpha-galactosidase